VFVFTILYSLEQVRHLYSREETQINFKTERLKLLNDSPEKDVQDEIYFAMIIMHPLSLEPFDLGPDAYTFEVRQGEASFNFSGGELVKYRDIKVVR